MPEMPGKNSGFRVVYTLKFLRKAIQDLKKIDVPFQEIIKEKLLILAENPDVLKNNIVRLVGATD